jgi:hypothetical protein
MRNFEDTMSGLKYYIILFSVLVVGCASVNELSKMDKLEMTTDGYEVSIRWSDFEMAASFIKDKQDPGITTQLENLKQFNVTAYTVKTFVPSENKSQVLIIADIQYFKKNGLIVKNYSHRQIWEYDEEKERWFLTSGLPKLD